MNPDRHDKPADGGLRLMRFGAAAPAAIALGILILWIRWFFGAAAPDAFDDPDKKAQIIAILLVIGLGVAAIVMYFLARRLEMRRLGSFDFGIRFSDIRRDTQILVEEATPTRLPTVVRPIEAGLVRWERRAIRHIETENIILGDEAFEFGDDMSRVDVRPSKKDGTILKVSVRRTEGRYILRGSFSIRVRRADGSPVASVDVDADPTPSPNALQVEVTLL